MAESTQSTQPMQTEENVIEPLNQMMSDLAIVHDDGQEKAKDEVIAELAIIPLTRDVDNSMVFPKNECVNGGDEDDVEKKATVDSDVEKANIESIPTSPSPKPNLPPMPSCVSSIAEFMNSCPHVYKQVLETDYADVNIWIYDMKKSVYSLHPVERINMMQHIPVGYAQLMQGDRCIMFLEGFPRSHPFRLADTSVNISMLEFFEQNPSAYDNKPIMDHINRTDDVKCYVREIPDGKRVVLKTIQMGDVKFAFGGIVGEYQLYQYGQNSYSLYVEMLLNRGVNAKFNEQVTLIYTGRRDSVLTEHTGFIYAYGPSVDDKPREMLALYQYETLPLSDDINELLVKECREIEIIFRHSNFCYIFNAFTDPFIVYNMIFQVLQSYQCEPASSSLSYYPSDCPNDFSEIVLQLITKYRGFPRNSPYFSNLTTSFIKAFVSVMHYTPETMETARFSRMVRYKAKSSTPLENSLTDHKFMLPLSQLTEMKEVFNNYTKYVVLIASKNMQFVHQCINRIRSYSHHRCYDKVQAAYVGTTIMKRDDHSIVLGSERAVNMIENNYNQINVFYGDVTDAIFTTALHEQLNENHPIIAIIDEAESQQHEVAIRHWFDISHPIQNKQLGKVVRLNVPKNSCLTLIFISRIIEAIQKNRNFDIVFVQKNDEPISIQAIYRRVVCAIVNEHKYYMSRGEKYPYTQCLAKIKIVPFTINKSNPEQVINEFNATQNCIRLFDDEFEQWITSQANCIPPEGTPILPKCIMKINHTMNLMSYDGFYQNDFVINPWLEINRIIRQTKAGIPSLVVTSGTDRRLLDNFVDVLNERLRMFDLNASTMVVSYNDFELKEPSDVIKEAINIYDGSDASVLIVNGYNRQQSFMDMFETFARKNGRVLIVMQAANMDFHGYHVFTKHKNVLIPNIEDIHKLLLTINEPIEGFVPRPSTYVTPCTPMKIEFPDLYGQTISISVNGYIKNEHGFAILLKTSLFINKIEPMIVMVTGDINQIVTEQSVRLMFPNDATISFTYGFGW